MNHLIFRHFEAALSKLSRVALLLVVPALLSQRTSYTGCSLYSAVPLAFTAYYGGLTFFTLAYRLSPFHPLAKYPGPVIARTSKWWTAHINATGALHLYYKSLHDRYGDVVRVGQCPRLPFVICPLIYLQAQMSSRFATLRLFTPYLAKVAYPKDHVRASHIYIYSVATSF